MDKKKLIVQGGAIVLLVLFFTLPLVQCTQDSSVNATGLQIAAKSGKLMENADNGYPIVFLLLVVPILLIVMGFKKPFPVLRIVSILGLVGHIAFMVGTHIMLTSGDGSGFELTGLNYLVIGIYVGIIGFIQYCIIQDKKGSA